MPEEGKEVVSEYNEVSAGFRRSVVVVRFLQERKVIRRCRCAPRTQPVVVQVSSSMSRQFGAHRELIRPSFDQKGGLVE